MAEKPVITYGVIMDLLETRHSKDFFVTECKDGQSWGRAHHRLDAWAMRRSYSQWMLSGYEIKMRRPDFLNDEKYVNYLPTCNALWFIAPPGVIDPKELPDEVGLLVPASTGSKLMTKKKAPIRTIEPPVALYEYLLMSRCAVRDEQEETKIRAANTREQDFAAYLRGEKSLEQISWHLADSVARDIRGMKTRLADAEGSVNRDAEVRARLEELGFCPHQSVTTWQLNDALRAAGLASILDTRDALVDLAALVQRHITRFDKETGGAG